jgi:hypothetical protein
MRPFLTMIQSLIAAAAAGLGRLQRPDPAHNVKMNEASIHETMTLPEIMVRVAVSQVGVTEEGGNNRGPRVESYQRATWLAGTGWAWCAAFVCWCVLQAIQIQGLTPKGWSRPRTAGAYDFENWALGLKPHGPNSSWRLLPRGSAPRRGDIVTFTWSHIGICTGYDGSVKRVFTVEGNASREDASDGVRGDGVVAKTHGLSSIRRIIRFVG